jgi:hypothetical protein
MMSFRYGLSAIAAILISLAATADVASANEDADAEQIKEVQGKWTRRQATPNGPVRVVKEHKGRRTVVTAYDDKENVIYAHESEFKIEPTEKVRIFTFFDRVITAGPNAGSKIAAPLSFVYRIHDDRFIEVHGLLESEATAPAMIIWERVKP